MANQKWIAISYCSSFLFVYFILICYSILPSLVGNVGIGLSLPQTETTIAVNATVNTLSGLSSFSSWTSILLLIVVFLLILMFLNWIMYSTRAAF